MVKSSVKPTEKKKSIKLSIWHRLRPIAVRLSHTPLLEVLFVASFILARWWQNSDFSYPSEIWLPLVIFSLTASIIYYAYRWVLGKGGAAHLAALALTYEFYDFAHLQNSFFGRNLDKLLPKDFSTYFSRSLFLAAVTVIATWAVVYGLRHLASRITLLKLVQLQKVLLFAVVFIFIIQLFKVTTRYWSIKNELAYHYPTSSLTKPIKQPTENKPDIYYLEYEDYTSADVLHDVYHYDQTPLLDYLSQQGFVNRQPAYSNYPVTMSSIASTLAMNYLPEFEEMFGQNNHWQTAFPYRAIVKDPPVVQALRQNGYSFDMLSSWWDFTRNGIKADSNPTQSYRLNFFRWHFYLSDLERDIINRSIFSPWLKKGVSIGHTPIIKYDLDRNPKETFESQQASLKAIASRADKSKPHFVFDFVLLPHSPYIFNADGSPTNYDAERNDNGTDEIIKYRNQVEYLNSQIKQTIAYIKQHSPNSVIIIQSDEGSYPKKFRFELTPNHYYNPIDLSLPEMRQKMGILASYYLPGINQPLTTQQLNSSVNAFRFVLSQYLGYDMAMLPDCHFAAGDKYSLYNYKLITDKLTGKVPPAGCRQYE